MRNLTLRAQITLVYGVALMLGLLAFASLSLFILDDSARTSLDQTLLSDTRTLRALLEVRRGKILFDESDRSQFARVLGVKLSGAVYDARGRVIISSTQPIPRSVRAVAREMRATPRLLTVGPRDERLRVAVVPIKDGNRVAGVAILWRSIDFIEDLDRHSAVIFAVAAPLIVAFAILLGSVVARRGLLPLRRVAELASEIEAHDLSRRLRAPTTNDELGRLCAAFDRMLDRLEGAFERERRFTSDASHELRGPLSVMKVEAELALRRPRTAAEYNRALHVISSEVDHLVSLTTDLLATARAGSAETSPGTVNLSAIIESVTARVKTLAENRGVGIAVDCDGERYVRCDVQGTTRVVFAVLHNALKHSPPGGRIDIRCNDVEGGLAVEIADQGPGFSPEALQHAFERFWRDDDEGTCEGTGLGLSIAQGIMVGNGGAISLRNRLDERGAVVEVAFRRA